MSPGWVGSARTVFNNKGLPGFAAVWPRRDWAVSRPIFLNDIEEAANEKSLPSQMRHSRRLPDSVGIVNDELPWDGMKIAARIDALEKRARAMRDVRKRQDEEIYKRAARYFYDDLRAAWERALEEVAFAHVIMRHRDYIRDKDLMRVSVLTEQDCKTRYDNFGKCCGHIAGHDASRGRNRAMPEPDELLADTQVLDAWVRSLRNRQNKLEKTRALGVTAASSSNAS